jgi:catechol 2,3-dioxygenase-like lactoylglutathione lyase family enzyme
LAVVVGDDPRFEAVLETALYHGTDEAPAVERFYGEVLGLSRVAGWDYGRAFRLGPGVLLLFDRDKLPEHSGPIAAHGASGPGHACLLARNGDYDAWKVRLEAEGVAITHEAEWPSGFRSFYFGDPAGNLLEIADGDLWPGSG